LRPNGGKFTQSGAALQARNGGRAVNYYHSKQLKAAAALFVAPEF
jgi:hypothetical protein